MEMGEGDIKMFTRSKCLLHEPDDLGSIPGTHIKVEGDIGKIVL